MWIIGFLVFIPTFEKEKQIEAYFNNKFLFNFNIALSEYMSEEILSGKELVVVLTEEEVLVDDILLDNL